MNNMTVDEMYAALVAGTVSKTDFEMWVEERRDIAYSNGYDEANYQHATNY